LTVYTSHSDIPYARSTQAAVIYEIISGLQLQSVTHSAISHKS